MSEPFQSTTQQFLDIYDITNNFVIMKDGTVSVILTVDAMNFGLLAEEEQDAIMYAYAGLLNSLNYPIQIIVQSRTKDVTAYLHLLQEQEAQTENTVMRKRIGMYREFVGNLIHERNVLDKKFYVVIPATSLELGFMTATSVLPGSSSFDIKSIERSVILEKAQNLLDPKRDHLIAQFARIGLYSRQLNTQEIIQLFYVRYNPEAAEGQQIGESNMYTTPLVRASVQESAMINAAQAQPTTTDSTTAGTTPDATQPQSQPPQTTPAPATEVGTPAQTPPASPEAPTPSTPATDAPAQPAAVQEPAATTPAAAPTPPANPDGAATPEPELPPSPALPEDAPVAPQPESHGGSAPGPVTPTPPAATTPPATPEQTIDAAATGGTQTSSSAPAADAQAVTPGQDQTLPEPTPAAPQPGSMPPVAPPASAGPSTADVAGIPQPTASQASTTPPEAGTAPDEKSVQDDLNATLQQIGGAPAETPAQAPTSDSEQKPAAAKPAGGSDLPELPEI